MRSRPRQRKRFTDPLATQVATWSLTSLQQRLVKTGGRLIKHSRYYWLLLAERHLTQRLFCGILRDHGAAVASRIRRAQSGAKFDDDAGRREKFVRNRSNKMHFRTLRAHRLRNQPLRRRWIHRAG